MLPLPGAASRRLEFELFTDDCNGLGERTCPDAKGAFDAACLTADVLRDVED